ncbi:hypothetical protein FACS1894182_14850 [Bacteroidia bacterium]|nr:hypothetical protein FACS1894182_14850 [Bacteroidia bacterium]
MYDFYEANWLLVRNVVVIKEELLNDSISILQITNHNRHIEKEYGISVIHDKKLFQKTTSKGIYFSEDSISYVMHYDFNSAKRYDTQFPTYYFFNVEKETIHLDTIRRDYLQKVDGVEFNEKDYQPKEIYKDFRIFAFGKINTTGWGTNQILFWKGFNFPLFCNMGRGYYYLLSEVVGYSDTINYVKEAYDAVWNGRIFWSREPMHPIAEPSDWVYARWKFKRKIF